MATRLKQIQPVLAFAAAHLDEDVSLTALAAKAGLSGFHLHRIFSAAAGETPKQFTLRLQLDRAAHMLLMGNESLLNVALSCGFQSHESFCRAFRRRFVTTPGAYRAHGFAGGASPAQARKHAALVTRTGPCIGLFHNSRNSKPTGKDMDYSITKKQLTPQPVLVVRRRVKRSEIGATLAEVFGRIYEYALRNGAALAGQPFTRYLEGGLGLITMEPGLPLATPLSGEGDIRPDILPGGLAAATMHAGPYEQLPDAYAAIQEWIETQGLVASGAPWEVYVTDPTDYPDPRDWKTEVFWPLTS
jgi:AraC-like DNA-binding protein/effector-binding domain-containing protein